MCPYTLTSLLSATEMGHCPLEVSANLAHSAGISLLELPHALQQNAPVVPLLVRMIAAMSTWPPSRVSVLASHTGMPLSILNSSNARLGVCLITANTSRVVASCGWFLNACRTTSRRPLSLSMVEQ